jgi:hypothetical protein
MLDPGGAGGVAGPSAADASAGRKRSSTPSFSPPPLKGSFITGPSRCGQWRSTTSLRTAAVADDPLQDRHAGLTEHQLAPASAGSLSAAHARARASKHARRGLRFPSGNGRKSDGAVTRPRAICLEDDPAVEGHDMFVDVHLAMIRNL